MGAAKTSSKTASSDTVSDSFDRLMDQLGKLREDLGEIQNRRGTRVRFHPDPEIFGKNAKFEPARLYKMARSKAYLFRGVEIRWSCDPKQLRNDDKTPQSETLHFPGGLADYLSATIASRREKESAATQPVPAQTISIDLKPARASSASRAFSNEAMGSKPVRRIW